MCRTRLTISLTVAVFALFCGSAHAQSCALPAPLQAKFESFGQLDAAIGGAGCRLTAMVNASAPRSALAYAYYRRAPSNNPLRFRFRIDTSGLADFSPPLSSALIFAAAARAPFPVTDGLSQLLKIQLVGGIAAGPSTLRISAADNAQSTHSQGVSIALSQASVSVGIELTRGTGGPGSLRYWIDANFIDPPTGIIESSPGAGLDNSEWGAVESVALGLGEMSSLFRANHADMPLVFDQIQSDDEFIFFNGYE